jgi:phosphoribosyl 1,2-cyclic phosphodiesterase/CheY-like chemotaxis protein
MASFYIVDDDPQVLRVQRALLEQAGHQVWSSTSSVQALTDVPTRRPDCVIVDILMPDLDGLALCKALRGQEALKNSKFVIVSAKAYEFDRQRAREIGASNYLVKPIDPETFVEQLERVLASRVTASFWGVRGTLPVPGKKTLRYGGNTSCVSMSFETDDLLVFDAGSGIKELSNNLIARAKERITARIFITHPHWDHINALPFFSPLYIPGNEFEVFGPANGDRGMRELVGAQMDGVFFPITMREFGAHVLFRDLAEETLNIGAIQISTMLLNHPGHCLGYRVDYRSSSVCYVTDNELIPAHAPRHNAAYLERLVDFVRGADALITDTTYTDAEYVDKVGWGHSSVGQVVDLAHRAEVKSLYLFHHDPGQNDDAIDAKLEQARQALARLDSATECFAPAEGDTFQL